MSILDKILEIYKKKSICHHCLGRLFSLLATNTSNNERGYSLLLSITMENHRNYLSTDKKLKDVSIRNLQILAVNANFSPAQKVLRDEGFESTRTKDHKLCLLCENIFLNLDLYIEEAKQIGINLSQYCENALRDAVKRLEKPHNISFSQKNHQNPEGGRGTVGSREWCGCRDLNPGYQRGRLMS